MLLGYTRLIFYITTVEPCLNKLSSKVLLTQLQSVHLLRKHAEREHAPLEWLTNEVNELCRLVSIFWQDGTVSDLMLPLGFSHTGKWSYYAGKHAEDENSFSQTCKEQKFDNNPDLKHPTEQ